MNPVQKHVYDAIAAGPRGSVPAPFAAMLDAPHIAATLQAVGVAIRFGGTLPDDLREVCILATAAACSCGYEWNYHVEIARKLGVSEALIAAAWGETPDDTVGPVHAALIELCFDLVRDHRVSPMLISVVVEMIGRECASEVVAIAGYYQALALFISAADVDEEPRELV